MATIEVIVRGGTPASPIGAAGNVTAQRRWTLPPGVDDRKVLSRVTALLNGLGAPEPKEN